MIIPYDPDLDSRCERRRRYARQVDRWLLEDAARQRQVQLRAERPARPRPLLHRLGRLVPGRRTAPCTAS